MTRKFWWLLGLAVFLGGIYVYYFTEWVNTPQIQILKSDRPIRPTRVRSGVLPITFTLDGRYNITDIRVLSVGALATNENAKPLWHLVARPKSVPLKGFFYGQRIRGMELSPTNSRPQGLQAGVDYRVVVRAGRARGELDFRATAALE